MTKYVKKVWLNPDESASTGSVCVFDGILQYKSTEPGIRSSFIDIKDCVRSIHLHRAYEDTEQDFINKVESLRDVLNGFIEHLKSVKIKEQLKLEE